MSRLFFLLCVLVLTVTTHAQTARESLLHKVHAIAAPGIPGSLLVYGSAEVIIAGKLRKDVWEPVVAAGTMGNGRVIALGHDGYFGSDALRTADTAQFIANAVRWTAHGKREPRVGIVQLIGAKKGLLDVLKADGFIVRDMTVEAAVKSCDVIMGVFSQLTPAQQRAVAEFVRQGGGLIGAETGWGWQSLNEDKSLSENGGNLVFEDSGIQFAGAMLNRTTKDGFETLVPVSMNLLNVSNALKTVHGTAITESEARQAVQIITDAVTVLPETDTKLLPQIRQLGQAYTPNFSEGQPLSVKLPLDRLAMTLSVRAAMRAPAAQVRAHPAAVSFPGTVPANTPRESATILMDTALSGWHSTGFYAAPGDLLTLQVPPALQRLHLRLRIGAHKDTLWNLTEWKRAPEITRTFPLDKNEIRAANPFGGAVYIEVPEQSSTQRGTVTIRNLVSAPYFVLGKTTATEWRRSRTAPAPWAEMVGKHVALTVPASAVRNLDDPDALMAHWDDVMTLCADFYAVPHTEMHPQRYCVDRQISAGYMHSGYPIMTWEDVATRCVDLPTLTGHDGLKNWGFYHELGHNYQMPDWTFDGTGEVTNNLFSLYGCEKFNGVTPDDYGRAHPAMAPAEQAKRLRKYLANGAKFADWQNDPFLALTMYAQIRQAFGWEPFTKVFAEYRALDSGQHPKTELERHDAWMIRMSRATGRNLGGFFLAWGVPTSETARKSLSNLPEWMPADWQK